MSLVSATHYQAVSAIKSGGNDMTMIVVKATASLSNEKVVVLHLNVFVVIGVQFYGNVLNETEPTGTCR